MNWAQKNKLQLPFKFYDSRVKKEKFDLEKVLNCLKIKPVEVFATGWMNYLFVSDLFVSHEISWKKIRVRYFKSKTDSRHFVFDDNILLPLIKLLCDDSELYVAGCQTIFCVEFEKVVWAVGGISNQYGYPLLPPDEDSHEKNT